VLLASPNFGVGGGGDATLSLVGEAAIAGAALSYACGAVYSRHSITGRALIDDPERGPRTPTPAEIALPQVASAAVCTTVASLVIEHPAGPGALIVPATLAAWFAVAWLGVLGSGVAYLLYFRIIRAWGATRSTLVTYVMPIVGIALGVLVLSEHLHPAEILGTVLVLGGLVLANVRVWQRRLIGRSAPGSPSTSASTQPAPDRLATAAATEARPRPRG
jgi:drug/metabolite transporter (DMT)-like permease